MSQGTYRRFTELDWLIFSGAANFADESLPFIGEFPGLSVVVDREGISFAYEDGSVTGVAIWNTSDECSVAHAVETLENMGLKCEYEPKDVAHWKKVLKAAEDFTGLLPAGMFDDLCDRVTDVLNEYEPLLEIYAFIPSE